MNKFLILGTGADINNIDFKRVKSNIITAGVNRVYEKLIPKIFFIYDLDTLMPYVTGVKEIVTHPDQLKKYFVSGRMDYDFNFITYYDKDYIPGYEYQGKHYDCGHGSINYLLRYLNNYKYVGQDNVFYIAGVPLLERIGHFYQDIEITTSKQNVLDRFFNDFLRLKRLGFNIVSLMPESRLNEIFPVEKIDIIYEE